MSNIIQQLEAEQMTREVPAFYPGDTVTVQVRVKEGERERLQAFEGVVIAKRNRGLHSAFTVRKISAGIGVERVFPVHSPNVSNIERIRQGKVRRAKLYYLRGLTGKSARITEKLVDKTAEKAEKKAKKPAKKAKAKAEPKAKTEKKTEKAEKKTEKKDE